MQRWFYYHFETDFSSTLVVYCIQDIRFGTALVSHFIYCFSFPRGQPNLCRYNILAFCILLPSLAICVLGCYKTSWQTGSTTGPAILVEWSLDCPNTWNLSAKAWRSPLSYSLRSLWPHHPRLSPSRSNTCSVLPPELIHYSLLLINCVGCYSLC